jgi:hypothetical protein
VPYQAVKLHSGRSMGCEVSFAAHFPVIGRVPTRTGCSGQVTYARTQDSVGGNYK